MSTCACLQPTEFVPALIKEPKLTLRLEIREGPAVTVIHCMGRLVFREENCFSANVLEVLSRAKQVVIDLSGVEMVDGFGAFNRPVFNLIEPGERADAVAGLDFIPA